LKEETIVIDAQKLTRRFGSFTAVDQVSFTINGGEVVGYLGPNGSGKTTTIRMLLGLLKPSDGRAQVLGCDVIKEAEALRAKVGYMSQKFALYQELTVKENLQFYSGVYGIRGQERTNEVLEIIGLVQVANVRVSDLPAGWRQRLALGTAILHRPKLLFLDEPTSGIDPSARRIFWDFIYELIEQNITAFVTTHYMDEAEYCTKVGIMQNGRLLAFDRPSVLKAQQLKGEVWDIDARPLLAAFELLQACPMVRRVSLSGDHLRAVTAIDAPDEEKSQILVNELARAGVMPGRLEQVEPTLEDVFLALSA
jgi:ABC-2 type transport system ATP-binding protein